MPAGNTCSGHSSGPVLWCMQGVRPCHFIDPGFCKPACVTAKTRICHPLCHFMVYAGGQHLSFYRPWLWPTHMSHPPKPAFVTPCAILWCMQGVNTCHFIDPGFCQPAFATPQNPHVSPLVLFYRSCRESDPSFCQSRHALKESMWLVWLHNLFMFI